MRFTRVAAALSVILALASACSTAGHPVTAPDPAVLDVGPYSRIPLREPAHTSEYHGRIIESVRMAEVIVDPREVDPALVSKVRPNSTPLPTPSKAAVLLADPVSAVLEKHGMLAGFAVLASDSEDNVVRVGEDRMLQLIVLRFPDPLVALQAAQEIDAVDASVNSDNVAVDIPGYPTAHGHWRPTVPTVAATLAQDSFVVSIFALHTSLDIDALTSFAAEAFDAQLPLLREFAPTPADKFTELDLDPDGMLARMVPDAPGRWPFPVVISTDEGEHVGHEGMILERGIVYGPRGLQGEMAGTIEQAESLGLNRFDRLVRFADTAAAERHFAEMRKTSEARVPIPVPTGLVDITCDASMDTSDQLRQFSCKLRHGRYIALIFSRDYRDIQQRAAAQYALLVNSE